MSSENASHVKQMIRTCVIIEARGQDNYTTHHTVNGWLHRQKKYIKAALRIGPALIIKWIFIETQMRYFV